MALPAYGVCLYLLNHKQTAKSLLSFKPSAARETLVVEGLNILVALCFLAYFAELHFRLRNLLLRDNWGKLGEYATKFALILLCIYIALFRCRNECPRDLFLEIEAQIYKIRKYLLLGAAAAATTSITGSALLSIFSIPTEDIPSPPDPPSKPAASNPTASNPASNPTPTDPNPGSNPTPGSHPPHASEEAAAEPPGAEPSGPESGGGAANPWADLPPAGAPDGPFRWSNLLGVLALSLADALGYREALDAKPYNKAVANVIVINMVLMPLLLVYVVWPLWIPQHPASVFASRLPWYLVSPLFSNL